MTDVRKAAAKSLAKVERVAELSEWIFEDIQPAIVETSEALARSSDVAAARDSFWKAVNAARLRARQKFMEEQIEGAYVGLYSYSSDARKMFYEAIRQLRNEEDRMVRSLLAKSEDAILSFEGKVKGFTTAALGNILREVARDTRQEYVRNIQVILVPIRERLQSAISKSDVEILSGVAAKSL